MDPRGRGWRFGTHLAPPRFLLFLGLLAGGTFAWRAVSHTTGWLDPAAMAFDIAALVFLASLAPFLRDCKADDLRRHANDNDANRVLVLVITTAVAFTVMAAIGSELSGARSGEPLSIAKLIGTLVLIWLFANTVYALHYAHLYYSREDGTGEDAGGLEFPGTATPDYADFLYFACTLGMTFQTSDVTITAPRIRRVVLLHSFAAFVFNIGVIAFSINTLGGAN